MNRYFLYLMLLNMLSNVIIFVPSFLIKYRYDGAVMSIPIAIIIGMAFTYLFSKVVSRFPEKGLPEVLEEKRVNKPFKIILFGGFSLLWFTAGLITLLGFIDILHRFINPELPKAYLLGIFLLVICFVIQLPTQKVMYLLEIILIINFPVIAIIILKALGSDYFNWDSVFEVGTHIFTMPSFKAIAVATYVFSGYANLMIFNRLFKEKIKGINFVIIFFVSILNLTTTFFIPIGMHGADGVHEYIYPWIMTADSLRLVYSPIERALFIFLMMYISITLLSVSVHWHVALELIKGTYSHMPNKKKNWWVIGIFFGFSILTVMRIDLMNPEIIAMIWLNIRFFAEAAIVLFSVFFIRRRKA